MKLTKDMKSLQISPERYMIAGKEKEDKGWGLVLLVRNNLKFQKILVDGQFKEYIIVKVMIAKNLHKF